MTKEEKSDNKDTKSDNKEPEKKEPNFPDMEPAEPKKEKKETESQDPELKKWMEETGSLENAYKRVQGSQQEVEKYKEELERQKAYQEQIAGELQYIYRKDPETAAKLFGLQIDQTEQQTDAGQKEGEQQQDVSGEIARQVQAQVELNSFKERNSQFITDDDDWQAIQDIALGFVGKNDEKGNPYNIQSALRDALLIRHKELIGDQAISEHLTSEAKRASASESGDIPGGSSDSNELSQDYYDTAAAMGIELTDSMKQHILDSKRKQ